MRDMLPMAEFYRGTLLVFGHRGAREQTPENTLPAFTQAADLGADGVEFDVQLSQDGEVVVIHDSTVERTTDGTGRVDGMPYAALCGLDAGVRFSPQFAGTRIPTLDQVLETVGHRLLLNIELKAFNPFAGASSQRLVDSVARAVRRHAVEGQVICSSFNPFILRLLRRTMPELPVGYLNAPSLPLPLARGWLAEPVIGRHEARHPHYSAVSREYMAWAHQRGYRVNVWTVNDPDDARRLRDLGVDMLITDRPDAILSAVRGGTSGHPKG